MILSVCGTQRNVGVTYFCLALSNYLCNMEQRQVAYLEVNATGEISAISGKSALQPGKTNFSHKGIHFYPQVTLDKLWELLGLSCLGFWHLITTLVSGIRQGRLLLYRWTLHTMEIGLLS